MAQDVESVLDEKLVSVNGGFSANTTFYHAHGIENRRDPFYWMLSANLRLSILGIIQAPFSMTVSQQNKNFSQPQPFNRFGISPTYRSVTGHFGHRTMNFSEYTLAGNMFLGAGIEVTPDDSFVRASALYGRFVKPVEKTAREGLVFATPAFRRTGYGAKVSMGRKKHIVDLMFFKAKDDANSIEITDEVDVTPEENLVLGVCGKHEMSNKIAFEYEYAYSMLSRDTRSEETSERAFSFANNLGGLFNPNLSSEFNSAFSTSMSYAGNGYQANIKYRKVDPGYRTLGSAFLNNGMWDVSGGLAWGMFGRKVNISTNIGVQQSLQEESNVRRVIYGINANYNPGERWSLASSYANFSTTTRQVRLQRDILIDSLEYFQVTRSGNLNIHYRLGNTTGDHKLFIAASLQDASDNGDNASTFLNLNVGEQMKIADNWQVSISASYNRNQSELFENTSLGPVANVNRAFLEGRLRSAFSATLLKSFLDGTLQSDVMNFSWANTAKVAKKHNVSVNIYYLNSRSVLEEEETTFGEFRGIINYTYSF